MCYEFELQGIKFERQMPADIVYKGKTIKGQRIDLLVESEVVVEIKAVNKLPEVALSQIISYLKATNLKRGLIINFNEKKLINGVKRIAN